MWFNGRTIGSKPIDGVSTTSFSTNPQTRSQAPGPSTCVHPAYRRARRTVGNPFRGEDRNSERASSPIISNYKNVREARGNRAVARPTGRTDLPRHPLTSCGTHITQVVYEKCGEEDVQDTNISRGPPSPMPTAPILYHPSSIWMHASGTRRHRTTYPTPRCVLVDTMWVGRIQ